MARHQEDVIAFLSNPATFGLPGAAVERVETHCSVVFLVGDCALKLKRPVTFSSLDYTKVELREAACRAEIELNRRTAPELYLGVHAICRMPCGNLALDGQGPIVDWVVAMRRFDRADLLDRLADDGCLTVDLITALADEIARFHQAAEHTAAFGGAHGMRSAIEDNHREQQFMESILGRRAVATLHKASLGKLACVAPLLDRRRAEGRVRRCHGDLRLANICLLDSGPTLFDAIEFSDQVSCTDVLFDLAFLLMDLHHRGLDVQANVLLNRYFDMTGDADGLATLPLMLSVRAGTRAYSLAAAVQRQANPDEAQRRAVGARSHMALASSLLLDVPARLVAVGGFDGSVKSSVTYGLAAGFRPAPGARILRDGTARRRLLGLPAGMRLPDTAYDAKTTEKVYACLAADAVQAVRAGFTPIIDASFVYPAQRQMIAAAAVEASVPFVGLWLGPAQDLQWGGAAGARGWHAIGRDLGPAAIVAAARRHVHGRPADSADQ